MALTIHVREENERLSVGGSLRTESIPMTLALCLPPASIDRVRQLLPEYDLRIVNSCGELDLLIGKKEVEAAIFDPSANAFDSPRDITRIFSKYPSAPLVAYVRPTPENLGAIFNLSKRGLRHVFVHPLSMDDRRLTKAVERTKVDSLTLGILAPLEVKLASLPAPLLAATIDLFERPQRYQTVSDIAREAGVPLKQVYRSFIHAELGPPKRLLVLARISRAYSYLRLSTEPIPSLAQKLGYNDSRILVTHLLSVFDCTPAELRSAGNSDEFLLRLIEWMCKPTYFRTKKASQACPDLAGMRVSVPAILLSRTIGFQLHWVWYLSFGAVLVQLALSMFRLRLEFARRLTFSSQPKPDGAALASAMVAAE